MNPLRINFDQRLSFKGKIEYVINGKRTLSGTFSVGDKVSVRIYIPRSLGTTETEVIITKDGEEILHRMWDGVCRRNVYSASKTYTALAVVRSAQYYWIHKKASAYAATPLAFCAVFILVGMFESVYAPFSAIGCTYLLVQAPLWRADLSRSGADKIEG